MGNTTAAKRRDTHIERERHQGIKLILSQQHRHRIVDGAFRPSGILKQEHVYLISAEAPAPIDGLTSNKQFSSPDLGGVEKVSDTNGEVPCGVSIGL